MKTALIFALTLGLTGCMSTEEQRQTDLRADGATCTTFGASAGSPDHSRCMLQQQQRRDHEQLLNMERARISSETARNNLQVLEAIRADEG